LASRPCPPGAVSASCVSGGRCRLPRPRNAPAPPPAQLGVAAGQLGGPRQPASQSARAVQASQVLGWLGEWLTVGGG
jgi:hypothetical protein